nr:MAG TPA: hypothetical protein [Caudoviricetes sp.]
MYIFFFHMYISKIYLCYVDELYTYPRYNNI